MNAVSFRATVVNIFLVNQDDFWAIVERVHLASKGDMDAKCKLLEAELRKLSADEVLSFDEYFSRNCHRAYAWDLWDAAYIICGGCSDDGFMDFRISMGREMFERALKNRSRWQTPASRPRGQQGVFRERLTEPVRREKE